MTKNGKKNENEKTETKDLTVPTLNNFAIMNFKEDIGEIIEMNLGGEELSPMDFDRIKVPSGGSKTWTVPSIEGEEEVKELNVVILHNELVRTYWRLAFGEGGGGQPPDCYSTDCIVGIGDPGGNCETCPYSKYKTGVNGRSQACKQARVLFLLKEDGILPIVLNVPPGSLSDAKKYLFRLIGRKQQSNSVMTNLTLDKAKNPDGVDYSKIVFKMNGTITGEELAKVTAYTQAIKPYISNAVKDLAASGGNEKTVKTDDPFDDALASSEAEEAIDV